MWSRHRQRQRQELIRNSASDPSSAHPHQHLPFILIRTLRTPVQIPSCPCLFLYPTQVTHITHPHRPHLSLKEVKESPGISARMAWASPMGEERFLTCWVPLLFLNSLLEVFRRRILVTQVDLIIHLVTLTFHTFDNSALSISDGSSHSTQFLFLNIPEKRKMPLIILSVKATLLTHFHWTERTMRSLD